MFSRDQKTFQFYKKLLLKNGEVQLMPMVTGCFVYFLQINMFEEKIKGHEDIEQRIKLTVKEVFRKLRRKIDTSKTFFGTIWEETYEIKEAMEKFPSLTIVDCANHSVETFITVN